MCSSHNFAGHCGGNTFLVFRKERLYLVQDLKLILKVACKLVVDKCKPVVDKCKLAVDKCKLQQFQVQP